MRLEKFILKEELENYYISDGSYTAKRAVLFTSRLGNSKHTNTVESFVKLFKEKGIETYIAYTDDSYLIKDKNEKFSVFNIDDDKGFVIDPKDTIIINRASVAYQTSSLDIISQLEKNHFFCVNTRECLETCSDKFRTYVKLIDLGIETPRTSMVRNEQSIENAHKSVGNKFPVILKTVTGTQGKGVFIAESKKSLLSVLQTIWSLSPETEIIIQEFIESEGDYRVHVLNDEVIASMKRIPGKEEFRANYHLGGSVEGLTELDDNVKDLAIKAAKAVGAVWSGVDVIIDKNSGNAYVLEVNSSPGTEGIEKATNIDVCSIVVDFLAEKKNWKISTFTCGYIENIWIDGIGFVKAKFDTGNGSLCSIHADEYEIDEKKKKISWRFKDKVIESDFHGMKKVVKGGLKLQHEERPIVKLDVTFNGETFKNFSFALTNRLANTKSNKSEVLINRHFMIIAGLNVNPSGKYLLSLKEPEEEIKDNA